MSRKIEAASNGAVRMSLAFLRRWKSYAVRPAEDHEPGDGIDQRAVRNLDEDGHDAEEDQRDQRRSIAASSLWIAACRSVDRGVVI